MDINGLIIEVLNKPNRNGRIYTTTAIDAAISELPEQLIGTIGMPDNGHINLCDASHVIKNIRVDGDSLIGDISVLETPKGKILKELITSGAPRFDFRLAGIGSLMCGVVLDYQILSINAVEEF